MEQGRIALVGGSQTSAPLPAVRFVRADTPDKWPSAQAWDTLAQEAGDPNPFFERWFLTPGLSHIAARSALSDRVGLLVVEAEGRLAGLLPLERGRRYYRYPIPHLAGWLHDNAFCGLPLIQRGLEAPVWQAMLDWIDRHAGSALFLHLRHFPEDAGCFAALNEVVRRESRPVVVVQREERALLQSSLSPESYFEQSISAKKRKELRRQHNRLAEAGSLSFERLEGSADINRWIEEYLALERKGWKGADGSALAQDQANALLFRDALTGAATQGRLERLALRLDGKPIAMLANFLCPPGAFSFKTAYDEDFARFSPGVLLQRENLALLARDGIAWADSCAAADHPMIERIWREKRTMLCLSIAIGGSVRRALARQIFRAERGTPLTLALQET